MAFRVPTSLRSDGSRAAFYLLYWAGYLAVFTLVQGLARLDFLFVLRNELLSLAPKVVFVTLVAEWGLALLLQRRYGAFAAAYLALLVLLAFVLRLLDNYVILRYFLTDWAPEPLISVPPFLYNAIKLQFLLALPLFARLFMHQQTLQGAPQLSAGPAADFAGLDAAAGENDFFYFRQDRAIHRLPWQAILYFEAQGNYLAIVTDEATFRTYHTISELEKTLPQGLFLRVHRSFIVSLTRVEGFSSAKVRLGGAVVPVGRSYLPSVKRALQPLARLEEAS